MPAASRRALDPDEDAKARSGAYRQPAGALFLKLVAYFGGVRSPFLRRPSGNTLDVAGRRSLPAATARRNVQRTFNQGH